jgi:hypothetical protein
MLLLDPPSSPALPRFFTPLAQFKDPGINGHDSLP